MNQVNDCQLNSICELLLDIHNCDKNVREKLASATFEQSVIRLVEYLCSDAPSNGHTQSWASFFCCLKNRVEISCDISAACVYDLNRILNCASIDYHALLTKISDLIDHLICKEEIEPARRLGDVLASVYVQNVSSGNKCALQMRMHGAPLNASTNRECNQKSTIACKCSCANCFSCCNESRGGTGKDGSVGPCCDARHCCNLELKGGNDHFIEHNDSAIMTLKPRSRKKLFDEKTERNLINLINKTRDTDDVVVIDPSVVTLIDSCGNGAGLAGFSTNGLGDEIERDLAIKQMQEMYTMANLFSRRLGIPLFG